MIDTRLVKLMRCFPGSFVNANREVIVHEKANEYFIVDYDCSDNELKSKLLEWLSRTAYKTCPFKSDKKNNELNSFILRGINSYLGTDFSKDDMGLIYVELGNSVNHKLTLNFIESGYDLNVLKVEGMK